MNPAYTVPKGVEQLSRSVTGTNNSRREIQTARSCSTKTLDLEVFNPQGLPLSTRGVKNRVPDGVYLTQEHRVGNRCYHSSAKLVSGKAPTLSCLKLKP
jgi:hypothetical protein